MRLTAVAARGTEAVLARELEGIGARSVEIVRGAVVCEGELETAYRACLFARTPSRILLPVARFPFDGPDSLYEGVRSVDWNEHLSADGTLAVDCVASEGRGLHTHYLALTTKDAVCDQLRERTGRRPSIDTERPDLRLHVHIGKEEATVSVDLAGESMHRRGYRPRGASAPVKETLAAALLFLAGWDERAKNGEPLVDPMCGSGTFLVEAAMLAGDVAPGLHRAHHGMLGWRGHDASLWERLRREAKDRARAGLERVPPILGFDASEAAVRSAREAAMRAGVDKRIDVRRAALDSIDPPSDLAPGLLVANPPYGERLGTESELLPLYASLGDVMRRRFPGWTGWVLTGSPVLAKHVGLRPARKLPVWNGPIECRFLEYPIASAKATGEDGPAWRRPSAEAAMFENRLRKNAKNLERWAEREGLDSYRIYDADIPEFNVAVDVYGSHAVVQEYAPPRSVDPAKAATRVRDVMLVVPTVLGIPSESVVLKVRKRQTSGTQYERGDEGGARLEMRERGHVFLVDLTAHLDTGLFSDHRELRAMAAKEAAGRSFLNLFAYTCTASVYAAKAGARTTTSVDLSSNYLAWGEENFRRNGLDPSRHRFVQADCLAYLARGADRHGVVFLNPPSYSRSHRMAGDFEVKRDHVALVRAAMRRVEPDGSLFFSTHARGFHIDDELLRDYAVDDISSRSVPRDYERSPHLAFRIRHR